MRTRPRGASRHQRKSRVIILDIMQWLTSVPFGEFVFTILVSMIPVVELRGGIPFGVATLGLPYAAAFVAAIIGNMIPVPFIVVYIRRIFLWMRRHMPRLNSLVDRLEKKAHLKGQNVTRYKYLGLMIFVAIPLPGTGAWTGTLAASLLDMDFKSSVLACMGGVLLAGCIMGALSLAGVSALGAVVA